MNHCREEESRTAILLGCETLEKLHNAHVAVFGVGGVGGHVCEALARAGVGALTLVDRDVVSLSNINRQMIALHSTVGRSKVEVMRERIHDINPECRVTAIEAFYLPETADEIPLEGLDYIVDAVDTVAAKIELAVRGAQLGIPVISAMGAGNKLSATGFVATDIYRTSGCPLARVMRRELKARGVKGLKVVYSPEPATPPHPEAPVQAEPGARMPTGSLPFVPGVAGLLLAGEVIRDLCAK